MTAKRSLSYVIGFTAGIVVGSLDDFLLSIVLIIVFAMVHFLVSTEIE